MLDGNAKLQSIAFVVSMIVIIGVAITFSILFILYAKYKIANIKNGHEDKDVEKELRRKYKKIIEGQTKKNIVEEEAFKYRLFQKLDTVETYVLVGDPANNKQKVVDKPLTIYETIACSKEKDKKYQLVLNIVFGIFYFALGALLVLSMVFKMMGQTLFFGNTTLYTVQTGSMEKANEANTYLKENNLTDQLEQYSLIGINKVESDDELELYDIVAYKHEDTVYIHRIIRKYQNTSSGVTYYTLRGDANTQSLSFELTLTKNDIIGKYNGFQNYGLGLTLIYLQSNIGIIAVCSALLFLIVYNVSESKIETAYYRRMLYISKLIDKQLGLSNKEGV